MMVRVRIVIGQRGGSIGVSRRGSKVGRLGDRRRHQRLLHGRRIDRLGDLGRVVHDGRALVRHGRRDRLDQAADVRHGRFLDDALLVVDLRLGNEGGRCVRQRCRVREGTGTGGNDGQDSGQHHLGGESKRERKSGLIIFD